jgi:diguanylate cyclase (GGDEF)-like protein/PAS domain S-box-containing protein
MRPTRPRDGDHEAPAGADEPRPRPRDAATDPLAALIRLQTQRRHFVAVLVMGPLAALAIVVLREWRLVSPTPVWLVPLLVCGGQVVSTSCDLLWRRSPTRMRWHARTGSQALVTTATIFATGWGPALAVGLVLVGHEALATAGSRSQRAVLAWNVSCLAAGQVALALGIAPSLLPVPEVYGLTVLVVIGIAFSYRSLATALADKEAAAAQTEHRERRFRALVQSSQDLVFVVNASREVTYASPSCTDILGHAPDVLLGADSGVFVHHDDIETLRNEILRAKATPGARAHFSIRVRHRDGTWRWIEGVATNMLDDPAVLGIVINARDNTERQLRSERQAAIANLGRVALHAPNLDTVVEATTDLLTSMIELHTCRVVLATDERPAGHDLTPADDIAVHVPVGDPAQPLGFVDLVARRPLTEDEHHFVESIAGVLMSSIVRSRAEDAIRHQALHDPLTRLPNRTLFNDRLGHALNRRSRSGGYVAVMIIDLDGFKTVNDSLGHQTGDALLVAVADRLRIALRGYDTLARLGGDEFALLVDDLDAPRQAGRVAQRALDALVEPLRLPDREVAIGASIGIALTDRPDADRDRLLSNADAAMYRARREGKGRYCLFESSMHTAAVERMELEQSLRSAIAGRALDVHYQPIVDTATGRITSFEALARWNDPVKGRIAPDTFIPLAEESGLILDLGRFVLLEACQQTTRWQAAFPNLRLGIAVNVSRLQLVHPGFLKDVSTALAAADMDPTMLTLEVTESVLASDSGRVIRMLNELRALGLRVAIDDFGTGYSSFATLAELPVDMLKIDKTFVDKLTAADGRGFVTAIMQLAHTLHLSTTAEGVEHSDQCEALRQLGCTQLQGYLFARPMPAADVERYLARRVEEAVQHASANP